MRTRLALLLLLAAAGLAYADDDAYPLKLIDRPLTLPDGSFQPFAAFQFIHDSNPSANAEAMQLALDVEVAPKVQVGAFTWIEVGPDTKFLTGLASIEYKLLNFAAVRADLGVARVESDSIYGSIGLGLPVRLKMSDTVAIISGRPYAWGAEDDIVQIRFGSASMGVGSTISDFHFPIGLLFQLSPNYSVAVRSGYRNQGSAGYVPAGADATASFSRLDVGVTLDVAGQISPSNGTGYFDIFTARLWAQLRL